jgi:CRP-like cAMP-binding protein
MCSRLAEHLLTSSSPLQPIITKLQLWAPLSDADKVALLGLPFTLRSLKAGHYIVWDGDRPQHSCMLLKGFAYRQKTVGNGGMQIFSLHMDGDLVDLQNALLGRADHNVQMLSNGEVALVPVDAIRRIAFERPSIGIAMWYETLVEGSIFREWIANNGRRDARARIAHLLCELALRLEVAGLGNQTGFELPMSQEWIADAVSLTPVHVNRVLKSLQYDGLIARIRRRVAIDDWDGLMRAGDFNPGYLHLDRSQAATS